MSVQVTVPPGRTGFGEAVWASAKRFPDRTVVAIEAPPTAAVSLLPMPNEALVIVVPFASGAATVTTSCAEPEVPALSVPRLQVTRPAACVPPSVAETKVVLAGSGSVSTTPVAFALPLLA